MPVTTNEIIDQRLKMQGLIGKERTVKLMTILDSSTCPFCGSHELQLIGHIAENGMLFGEDRVLVGKLLYRFNCKECGEQFVPKGVEGLDDFGVV